MGFQVGEFFVGYVVDEGQQVGEAVKHLSVELSCELHQLHVDEVEGGVGWILEFRELRDEQ